MNEDAIIISVLCFILGFLVRDYFDSFIRRKRKNGDAKS